MSDERIAPEAVEAAYELLPREPDREDVEAAIRAADDARGLKVERTNMTPALTPLTPTHWRYISDWHPVESDVGR